MMLGLLRWIPENDAGVRRGEGNRTGPHTPRLLTGCTVGLVGYGRIGPLVARRLAGFDVELLVSDPALGPSDSPRPVELAELLAVLDAASLHTPLIPATLSLSIRPLCG